MNRREKGLTSDLQPQSRAKSAQEMRENDMKISRHPSAGATTMTRGKILAQSSEAIVRNEYLPSTRAASLLSHAQNHDENQFMRALHKDIISENLNSKQAPSLHLRSRVSLTSIYKNKKAPTDFYKVFLKHRDQKLNHLPLRSTDHSSTSRLLKQHQPIKRIPTVVCKQKTSDRETTHHPASASH